MKLPACHKKVGDDAGYGAHHEATADHREHATMDCLHDHSDKVPGGWSLL